ncbi:MAG: TatD family hydrolase [Candidatus Edwardsbacteria bacterium]
MLFDTHAHLVMPDYQNDLDEVIKRAKEASIFLILNVGFSLSSSHQGLKLAQKYEGVYTAVGIHPHEANKVGALNLTPLLRNFAKVKKVIAIGETGLDYYKLFSPKDKQEEAFRQHIKLARELHLPLIVHCREAHQQTLQIIKEENYHSTLWHCFSGDLKFAKEIIKLGHFISLAGPLTFPHNKKLPPIIKEIPLERILIETDCPYLTPEPHRGKRNEPAYLQFIALELAKQTFLTFEDIARITTHNARKFFRLLETESAKIAYKIRNSLYLNITNRCTNHCIFCVRNTTDFVKGHNLRLKREPTLEEIMEAIEQEREFTEVVFCGYGEPLLRLELVKEVAKRLRKRSILPVRLNTNGQGNLIHQRNIVPELVGLIDEVSVSLNAPDTKTYEKICPSKFGSGTYEKIKEFILECKKFLPKVSVTVLTLPGIDLDACKRIAEKELGVSMRVRRYNVVG